MKRFLIISTMTLILAPIMFGCNKQGKGMTVRLIDELPRARIICAKRNQVIERTFVIKNEKRRVLSMHPPAQVEYDLLIPAAAKLTFEMGMPPFVWTKSGDGVLFKVDINDGTGERQTVFSQYINPKAVEPDRRWHKGEVDFSLFEGQKVTLILVTERGPQNNGTYDNAGWGEPQITGVLW